MSIVFAEGMSRPFSTIVVARRRSAARVTNARIARSSSPSDIWPWALTTFTSGTSARELLAPDAERLDPVVDDVDLPAAVDLGADRLADHGVVHRHDVRVDREAVLRRRLDHGQVADAREREVEGARDRRRGHREDVDGGAPLLDPLLLRDAEALLLVHDEKAEVLELHVLREDPVRADDDVERSLGEAPEDLLLLFLRAEAREEVERDRERREPALERPEVLVREDRRRREKRGLLAVEDALEDRAHRDLGLAVSDVAAEEAVHRLVGLHVALHVADRGGLVGRLRVLERVLELLLPGRVLRERVPGRGRAARVELQELVRDVLDRLPDGGLPPLPAERRRAGRARGAARRPPRRTSG